MNEGTTNKHGYIVLPFKSAFLGLILSLFLGPIGLLYVSWLGSIIMLVITCILLAISIQFPAVSFLFVIAWAVSIYWTVMRVEVHNARLLRKM